jgi:hypothetical protein
LILEFVLLHKLDGKK